MFSKSHYDGKPSRCIARPASWALSYSLHVNPLRFSKALLSNWTMFSLSMALKYYSPLRLIWKLTSLSRRTILKKIRPRCWKQPEISLLTLTSIGCWRSLSVYTRQFCSQVSRWPCTKYWRHYCSVLLWRLHPTPSWCPPPFSRSLSGPPPTSCREGSMWGALQGWRCCAWPPERVPQSLAHARAHPHTRHLPNPAALGPDIEEGAVNRTTDPPLAFPWPGIGLVRIR